jgi:hypothetical protein
MGSVFRRMVTRPLPDGAKIVTRDGKRVAEWIDGVGKKHHAPINGPRAKRPGIRERATTYTAQYRDGNGVVRRVPTGCKSLAAARSVLRDLESRAEKVKSGLVTQTEADVADHADTAMVEHIGAYVAALACKRGKGARVKVSPQHVENVSRTLRAAVDECGFKRLRDLRREAVERWVARLIDLPAEAALDDAGKLVAAARPSARTINAKLVILTAWGNWLVRAQRLASNPFERLRADVGLAEEEDVRRCRRALTAEELSRLLTVASLRPIAEYGRETVRVVDATRPAKSRATWQKAGLTFANIGAAADRGRGRLRPDVLERLERAGWERALLYAVLCTTGLRKGGWRRSPLPTCCSTSPSRSSNCPGLRRRTESGPRCRCGRTWPLSCGCGSRRRRRRCAGKAWGSPGFHGPSVPCRCLRCRRG